MLAVVLSETKHAKEAFHSLSTCAKEKDAILTRHSCQRIT